jgi:hypothetical protein
MKSPLKLFSLLCLITIFGHTIFAADEWAQFRGPNGTGVSATTNLPVEFGPEKCGLENGAPARPFIAGADTRPDFYYGAHSDHEQR